MMADPELSGDQPAQRRISKSSVSSNDADHADNPKPPRRRFSTIDDHTWTYVNEQLSSSTPIMGYGNVPIASYQHVAKMGPDRAIDIHYITWNVNEKPAKFLSTLTKHLMTKNLEQEKHDVIVIALQEIPPSSTNFHEEALRILMDCVGVTHETLISHRSWTQMMMIFVRKEHATFATEAVAKFVPAAAIPKPMRTKGGIGICFRLYQRWIVAVGCHLSHGSLQQRVQDYHKIVRTLKFPSLHSFTGMNHILAADIVIWGGDLNFRIDPPSKMPWYTGDATEVEEYLQYDQLRVVQQKAIAFMEFDEATIRFPPTHKFENDSEQYVKNRIHSYTDRILYISRQSDYFVRVKDYCSIKGASSSDHSPVYCTLRISVINKPIPNQYYASTNDHRSSIINVQPK